MTTNIGKPNPPAIPGALPPGYTQECKSIPFEFANSGTAPITVTCAQITAAIAAGAAANNCEFSDGSAVTGAAPQSIENLSICAACVGTPVCLDDGTQFNVTCDAGGVTVMPNGGTNGVCLSCGGTSEINCGTDEITLAPGAALVGSSNVCQYKDKSGTVVPKP
jgi:hypothetical protein